MVINTHATALPQIPCFFEESSFSNWSASDGRHHRWLPELPFLEVLEEDYAHEYSPGMFCGGDLMAVNYRGNTSIILRKSGLIISRC